MQLLPTQGSPETADDDAEDAWRRALVLMASCSDRELLDAGLAAEDLLYRLFHEDGVRVFQGHGLHAQCRCSRERVESVLRVLPPEDIDHMEQNGKIEVVCEFCNNKFEFESVAFKGSDA